MVGKVKHQKKGVTRVSRKNQITLPVAALREAQVGPGDQLQVTVAGHGRLMLTAVADPLDELIGSAPGLSAATGLEALRDEWGR
jgi:bifunctional DNA-binding transcriptional regulator/antitoxin component of YhaV-PrlF toxin-antitoxin module